MILSSLIAPSLAKLFMLMSLSIIVVTMAFIVITMAKAYESTTYLDLGISPVKASATGDFGTSPILATALLDR